MLMMLIRSNDQLLTEKRERLIQQFILIVVMKAPQADILDTCIQTLSCSNYIISTRSSGHLILFIWFELN